VRINGSILDSGNNQPVGGFITYELENKKEHSVWVDLTSEGTAATVSWRKPSDSELRKAYGLADDFAGPMPARPTQIGIKATGTPPTGPKVFETLSIRLAEVQRFTKLKVKLNVMDDRTASDLYGRVTSEEYYVLMIRLINDIKDEVTGLPTNESIIAYSGSLEIAVGLEKKYLPKSGSSFPRVLSGSAVSESAKILKSLNGADDDASTNTLKAEVVEAQNELNEAIKDSTTFLNEYNKAIELYDNNRSSDTAYASAESARSNLQIAINRIEIAWERVFSAKENLVRLEYSKKTRFRPEIGGPDFLINDGKWHAVSRADFGRLVPENEHIPRFSSTAISRRLPALPKPIRNEAYSETNVEEESEQTIDPPLDACETKNTMELINLQLWAIGLYVAIYVLFVLITSIVLFLIARRLVHLITRSTEGFRTRVSA